MAIQKLFSSRANNTNGQTFVGEHGHIFYDESVGQLRLSDGATPGGLPIVVASTSANLGNLYVAGSTISTIYPNEDLNLDSNGTGNVNIVGKLQILTSTGFYSTTPVLSADQYGNVTVNGNLITNGTTYLVGTTNFIGPTTHTGNLTTNGSLITNGSSYFNGAVTEIGNVTVTGNSTNNGPSVFNGNITANGNVTINGTTTFNGATIRNGDSTTTGNLTVYGSTINIGPTVNTGTFTQTGNIAITGNTVIQVTTQDSFQGAVEITGDSGGSWQTPVNTGVMLHVTGQASLPSRIYNDAMNNYALFVGRRFDGTMASPSAVQANEDIFRIAGGVYTSGGWANIGPSRIAFTSSENQGPSNQGGRIEFWTTANASGPAYANIQRISTIDAAVGVWATQFTTQGNVTANYFVGNGSALTGISTYSNTNVASYLPTYSGNIAAGNVAITNNETVGGNVTVTGNVTAANVNATLHGNVVGVASSVGTNATSFAGSFISGQVTVPSQTFAKNTTTLDVTVTVTGLTTSHKVMVMPAADMTSGAFISAAYPSSANTLGFQMQFWAPNGGGTTLSAFNLTYWAWI